MASYNKVVLVGNLTRDPELRYTAGGTAVATFGLAVNRKYRQGEETKEETLFIDIVAFGKQAETVEKFLKKGRPVLVDGVLRYRKWEDKQGQQRSKHEVSADVIQFLGQGRATEDTHPSGDASSDNDDIPF